MRETVVVMGKTVVEKTWLLFQQPNQVRILFREARRTLSSSMQFSKLWGRDLQQIWPGFSRMQRARAGPPVRSNEHLTDSYRVYNLEILGLSHETKQILLAHVQVHGCNRELTFATKPVFRQRVLQDKYRS